MFFRAGFDTRTRTRISLSLCLHKDKKKVILVLVLFFLQGYFHALLVHGRILCGVRLVRCLGMRGLLVGCFEVHCVAGSCSSQFNCVVVICFAKLSSLVGFVFHFWGVLVSGLGPSFLGALAQALLRNALVF